MMMPLPSFWFTREQRITDRSSNGLSYRVIEPRAETVVWNVFVDEGGMAGSRKLRLIRQRHHTELSFSRHRKLTFSGDRLLENRDHEPSKVIRRA